MSAKPWPKGLVTAIVTPLKDDRLDVPALERVVEHQIAAGAAGLVVTGGTGEYSAMIPAERAEIVRETVRIAAGRTFIVAQTGCLATKDAISLSLTAEEAGADGLLVASPYGEPISWRERVQFYRDLDARISTPVMAYNTAPSGLMTFDEIIELTALDSITAVKDSSGDPILMGDLLDYGRKTGFAVYVGMDSCLYEAVLFGAHGAVFGAANIIPERLAAVIDELHKTGSTSALLDDWRQIRPVLRFLEGASSYVGLCKAGCALRGLDVGDPRPPVSKPDADEIAKLKQHLDTLGVSPI